MKLLFVISKITISIYKWNYDRGALSGYGEHEGLTGVSFEKCDNDRGENLTVRAESSRHRIAYIAARYYDLSFRNPSISRFVTEPTSGSRRTTISGVPCDHTRTYTSVENAKFSNDRFSLLRFYSTFSIRLIPLFEFDNTYCRNIAWCSNFAIRNQTLEIRLVSSWRKDWKIKGSPEDNFSSFIL